MVNPEHTAAYRENMANFVRDVRNDSGAPDLSFVIAVSGVGGEEDQAEGKQRFKEAQSAVGEMPEFKGNVAIVQTDQCWDKAAEAVFKKGWKQNPEE